MSIKTVIAASLVSMGGSLGVVHADVRVLPVGAIVETLDGVPVFANGPSYVVSHGKHFADDGYYFGQKWQCVEFIKRYLYVAKKHRLPNVWGHAKHFFDASIKQGDMNPARGMLQFRQGGEVKPQAGDLIVFDRSAHGHVAIVSKVEPFAIEVVQQNMPRARISLPMWQAQGGYHVGSEVMPAVAWLRVP